jgi:hypothetical protein
MGWDKNEPEFIGASDKITAAQKMRLAARDGESDNIPEKPSSQIIPVTLTFLMAAGLAMLLLGGALPYLSGWRPTGIEDVDHILFGDSIQKMTGNTEMDHLLVIMIRAAVLFLAAGIAPFLAAIAVRIAGKKRLDPFVACWAVLIALPLFYFLLGKP